MFCDLLLCCPFLMSCFVVCRYVVWFAVVFLVRCCAVRFAVVFCTSGPPYARDTTTAHTLSVAMCLQLYFGYIFAHVIITWIQNSELVMSEFTRKSFTKTEINVGANSGTIKTKKCIWLHTLLDIFGLFEQAQVFIWTEWLGNTFLPQLYLCLINKNGQKEPEYWFVFDLNIINV